MPIQSSISATKTHVVNLRIRTEIRALIDQAAKAQGKTRSEFMIDAARRAAEESLLDQTPGGEGFERLMSTHKPWNASCQIQET